MNLEELMKIDLDKLHIDDRVKVQKLIKELYERKRDYPILEFVPLPHQKEVVDAVGERESEASSLPKYKYIMFI